VERTGHLRLKPRFVLHGDIAKAPNLLLQKFPASEFEVETRIELPDGHASLHAGLVVAGESMAALDAQNLDGGYRLCLKIAGASQAALDVSAPALVLKLKVSEGGVCRLGVATPEAAFYQIGPSFQATPGRWIGAKVGLYCITTDVLDASGHADFAWFRFGPVHHQSDQRKSRTNGAEVHDHASRDHSRSPASPSRS
ncbi:MAG TPA: hypothetical protein VGE67_04715, partial [Haloferula sp.]